MRRRDSLGKRPWGLEKANFPSCCTEVIRWQKLGSLLFQTGSFPKGSYEVELVPETVANGYMRFAVGIWSGLQGLADGGRRERQVGGMNHILSSWYPQSCFQKSLRVSPTFNYALIPLGSQAGHGELSPGCCGGRPCSTSVVSTVPQHKQSYDWAQLGRPQHFHTIHWESPVLPTQGHRRRCPEEPRT